MTTKNTSWECAHCGKTNPIKSHACPKCGKIRDRFDKLSKNLLIDKADINQVSLSIEGNG